MSTPQRLPTVNSDDGQWGDILNQYISLQHYNTELDDPLNGSHKTITIRPGTVSAGTAPLKFTSGQRMSSPEAGAMEFLTDRLYFTQTTSLARKIVATYPSNGSTGDMYYLDSNGNFTNLALGSTNQVLTLNGGLPTWQTLSSSINNMDGGNASSVYGGSYQINGGSA